MHFLVVKDKLWIIVSEASGCRVCDPTQTSQLTSFRMDSAARPKGTCSVLGIPVCTAQRVDYSCVCGVGCSMWRNLLQTPPSYICPPESRTLLSWSCSHRALGMHAKLLQFSHVQLFVTKLTIALHEDRLLCPGILQERRLEWLPCTPPGGLPIPVIKPTSLTSHALAGRFFTTRVTWEAPSSTQEDSQIIITDLKFDSVFCVCSKQLCDLWWWFSFSFEM